MTATPPDGYTVPKIVTDLVAFAESHGWKALVDWTPPDYEEPFMTVCVGRKVTEADGERRGPWWQYKLTYHSRDCGPGKVKGFRAGLAQTPDHPQWGDAPSVKKIREVIAANPAPKEVTP